MGKRIQKRRSILRQTIMFLLAVVLVSGTVPGIIGQGSVQARSCLEETAPDSNGVTWYLIGNAHELSCIGDNLNGNYKLTKDITAIDMVNFISNSATLGWVPIGDEGNYFTGVLDGAGHSIDGLTASDEGLEYMGLFARLDGAVIKNLNLTGVSFTAQRYVGALAGRSEGSQIEHVNVSGQVQGDSRVGGLVGRSEETQYTNNKANVTVAALNDEGQDYGGFIGRSTEDVLIGNTAMGNVVAKDSSESIGGFIGQLNDSVTSRNSATGNVEGNLSIGGFIGEMEYSLDHSIDNNYATGSVFTNGEGHWDDNSYGAVFIGGFIGNLNVETEEDVPATLFIKNNYYSGSIYAGAADPTTVGSFIGSPVFDSSIIFQNNYWDIDKVPNFVDNQSQYASGETTQSMHSEWNYATWDFTNIWDFQLGVNNGYPLLRPYITGEPPVSTTDITFEPGYPKQGARTPTTSKITVKLNQPGRVYFADQPFDLTVPQLTSEMARSQAINKQAFVDIAMGEEKSFIVKNLTPGTDYNVYVVAEDTNGQLMPQPGQMIFKTLLASPVSPSNVTATAGDGYAKVTWSSNPNVTFSVYMYEGTTAPEDPDAWIDITNFTTNEQLVTELTNGISYVFAVKAHYIEDGSVSEFIPSNVVTPQAAGTPLLPDAPETIVAQAGDGKATVYWAGVINVNQFVLYKYQGTQAPQDKHDWIKVKSGIEAASYTVDGLTNGLPYVFAIRSSNENGLSDYKVSGPVTPKGSGNEGGGTPTPGPTPNPTPTPSPSTSVPAVTPPAPQKEVIKVNVENGDQAATVASLEISRTRGTDGTVKDELQLNQSKAQSIIDQLKQTGSSTAVILIPDAKDEVLQWDLNLSSGASALLAEQGVNLVISNPNVRITIPASSLKDRTDDIYFRLVPVKKEAERADIQTRAQSNESIIQFAGTKDIQILGRPMTIETNLQSRPVTLVLPVVANQLAGVNSEELGVYIEHSDGTKELVHGKLVTLNSDNQQGVEIEVDHFSTFSIVKVKDWTDNTLKAQPYIQGYADGSFRPERSVTRAEMATLITRILGTSITEGNHTFKDVKSTHWAQSAIAAAAQSGYVKGYTDGSFKPDQAMTRAELASVLQHLLNTEHTADATNTFNDVNNHWAQQAIARLNAAGVVTGYEDGTFRPAQPVTRAEAVTMLNKLLGLDPATNAVRQWSDVPDTHWAYKAIEAASISQ
ncbi:S-layer homology domain-containing protein [Paenibacillus sp. FSL K6-1318]|uniref:S-layer homology domain-containing protein n=1 Tax=Paenibacillus sp. FSL K6-1318 TaxID=2975291 RepID=UPI0030ECC2DD